MRLIDADTLKAEFTGNFNGGYYTVPEIHAHIDTAPTIGGWISAKDRLPERSCTVACLDACHNPYAVKYSAKHEKFNADDTDDGDAFALKTIDYWMPLPEFPKEE